MVNINDVTVTRDMAYAKVYVTFVGTDDSDEAKEGVQALNKAAGFVRSLLAKELSMRSVPRLQFIYDKTSIRGQQLSSLIDRSEERRVGKECRSRRWQEQCKQRRGNEGE